LTRPGIVAMVLVTMAVAAWVTPAQAPPWPVLAHALAGAGLVIAGAIAINQRLERFSDARMARTAQRPLPAGRLSARQVTAFGILLSVLGIVYLAVSAQPAVGLLAAASWVFYVWVYTPAKAASAWQTPLGAVAGAMPTLMGAGVAGDLPWNWMALTLFGVVYFWQFPHAMAIAWLYREQFAAAQLKVATVVDPSVRTAARMALGGAIALLGASLIPSMAGLTGWGYGATAALLGLTYLGCAARFLHRTTDPSARTLLRASLAYLPAISGALLWAVRG